MKNTTYKTYFTYSFQICVFKCYSKSLNMINFFNFFSIFFVVLSIIFKKQNLICSVRSLTLYNNASYLNQTTESLYERDFHVHQMLSLKITIYEQYKHTNYMNFAS